MNGIGMQLICSYLHKNPNNKYKELKLLGCNLEDDDLFLLVKTLLDHNINILILNLSNNKIGDESAANILDLVKEHQALKGLSLYNNLISDLLKEKLKEYTEFGRENLHSTQLYL
jgi:Ran GTPase-activating protein (RanGAP) involved in mRNA processing and transport